LRLKVIFKPHKDSPAVLPINYNHLIQGFIYDHLDEHLTTELYEEELNNLKSRRRFKLFTFSRLIPLKKPKVEKGKILFSSPIVLIVASPFTIAPLKRSLRL